MISITKELEWDMGHRVPNHKSKCRNPHGHRYKVHLKFNGDLVGEKGSSDEGMVMDFSDIKTISKEFIDGVLDHGFMFYKGDDVMSNFFQVWSMFNDPNDWNKGTKNREESFKWVEVDFIPTAENIAKFVYEHLAPQFEDKYGTGLRLSKVTLWETPTSFAEYDPMQKITIDCLLTPEELQTLKEELSKDRGTIQPACHCSCNKPKNPFEVRKIEPAQSITSESRGMEVGYVEKEKETDADGNVVLKDVQLVEVSLVKDAPFGPVVESPNPELDRVIAKHEEDGCNCPPPNPAV